MDNEIEGDDAPFKLPSFRELRAILSERPAGEEGAEVLDAALDLFAEDFAERWPRAPTGAAFYYATVLVAKALEMGSPGDDDDDGGGRGPVKPAPTPAPEMLTA